MELFLEAKMSELREDSILVFCKLKFIVANEHTALKN